MASMEAFLGAGAAPTPGAVIITQAPAGVQLSRFYRPVIDFTYGFSDKDFVFDKEAGMADEHVQHYYSLLKSGTQQQVSDKLRSFIIATRNALKERLTGVMDDAKAQQIFDIIGRMKLLFEGGILKSDKNFVDEMTIEINDLTNQLISKRQKDYDSASVAMQAQEAQEWGVPGTPGGGVASVPVPEKTTMQKVGPLIALAAGGIATYFALR